MQLNRAISYQLDVKLEMKTGKKEFDIKMQI